MLAQTTNQEAIRRLFQVERDHAGNLSPLPGIYPNTMAPIVHVVDGARALSMYRWDLPTPPDRLRGIVARGVFIHVSEAGDEAGLGPIRIQASRV